MLPVVKLGVNDNFSTELMDILEQQSSAFGVRTRLEYTSPYAEADEKILQVIEKINGICLYIIEMDEDPKTAERIARMGKMIMRQNRDNYILYILPKSEDVGKLLQYCVHPFGILVVPPDTEAISSALSNMMEEYSRIVDDETEDDNDSLLLQDGGVFFRVPLNEVSMIEALNKKLIIYYGAEILSVYSSISALAEKYQDTFIRCHRSYLVNRKYVKKADMSNMMLYLTNGQSAPIARSNRNEIKEFLKHTGGKTEQ